MGMLDQTKSLPDDPSELRLVAVQLAATVKSQALRIAKLEHQLAGHRRHRFTRAAPRIESSDNTTSFSRAAISEADDWPGLSRFVIPAPRS